MKVQNVVKNKLPIIEISVHVDKRTKSKRLDYQAFYNWMYAVKWKMQCRTKWQLNRNWKLKEAWGKIHDLFEYTKQ